MDQNCCRAPHSIRARIVARPPAGASESALGVARPLSLSGINVTIFESAVKATANLNSVDPTVVLAHALAHEISHVLQRSVKHSSHGLMSAAWGDKEFDLMRRVPLRFATQEIDAMAKMPIGEACAQEKGGTVELP